jgi:hypothetical protein
MPSTADSGASVRAPEIPESGSSGIGRFRWASIPGCERPARAFGKLARCGLIKSVSANVCNGHRVIFGRATMVSMEMFVFTTDGIQQLHEWAHASISIVLDHLSTFPAADYQKELPGFGFSTLQKQVVHIFNCEGFWIHVIKGLPYVDRDPATCSDVADARLLQQQVSRWTEEYCWPSRINNSTLMRNFVSRMEISPYALLRSSSITFLRTRSITKGR